ncbi:MAG TPA: septum site-determining protein MinC [Kofleriaceae bacterium]
MSQAPSVAFAVVDSDLAPPPALVTLKGTTRGLEIQVASAPSAEALAARLTELLAEAPGFFAGSDARVTFETALPTGALACLEAVAAQFELVLLEIVPASRPARSYAAVVRRVDEVRRTKLADGSGPIAPTAPAELDAAPAELDAAPADRSRAATEPSVTAADAPPDLALDAAPTDDAAPIEVALANTAPYFVEAIAADVSRAEAAAIEAELATATPIAPAIATPVAPAPAADPAVLAAAAAMAEDLALSMAGDLIETKARALAEQLVQVRAQELAMVLAEELAVIRAQELAAALAEARTAELVEARAIELVEARAAALAEAKVAELAPALAAELAEVLAESKASAILAALPASPKLVIGPVRSGVIVDHTGHVLIIGDVNPGAEVRAHGSIIVLGRLRGVAHAAIGREAGAIIALSLQPQQLRIGRMVARAGAGDRPSDGAEIAYLTGETIVVERFLGRLPSGLAASI